MFGVSATCKITSEYAELREQAAETLKKPYDQCLSSAKNAKYWKAVSNCLVDAKSETTTECEKLVAHAQYPAEYVSTEHCEILKPSFEQFKSLLNELREQSSVKKCET